MRARLGTKLRARQKTGFAFNFNLDADREVSLEENFAEDEAGERNSFRFGFGLSEDPAVEDNTETLPRPSRGKTGGVGASPKLVQDGFDLDVRESVAQAGAVRQKKKKPSGKKKRKGKGKAKGKGKGKAKEIGDEGYDDAVEPSTEIKTTPLSLTADAAINASANPASEGDSEIKQSTNLPNSLPLGIDNHVPPSHSLSPLPAVSRTPPGLTLESWKDPALTIDERRRRRFGRGVRNLAAIQRSCESRKGLSATSGEMPEKNVSVNDGRIARPDPNQARDVEGLLETGVSTGSSVFAFGFDIGITFNGGDKVDGHLA